VRLLNSAVWTSLMWKSDLDTILRTVHATLQLPQTKLNIILIHNYGNLNRIILRSFPLNFSIYFCIPYHYNIEDPPLPPRSSYSDRRFSGNEIKIYHKFLGWKKNWNRTQLYCVLCLW